VNDRPYKLDGKTYCIKPQIGNSDESLNITINNRGGRPYEVFLECQNPDLFQWLNFIGRCVSTMLQRMDDIERVITLMDETFDPRGKYIDKGVEYKSVVAHIGAILRRHVDNS